MDGGERHAASQRAPLKLADLLRWEDHGATWRVLELGRAHALVELCTCHGEPVDVVRAEEPALVAFIRANSDV